MNLIDWPAVVRNALWIVGLSIVLAAWSYLSWLAARRGVRVWRAIDWPMFAAPASAGLALFAASLAWGATRAWERILWIFLAAAFLAQMVQALRQARRQGWSPAPAASGTSAQNSADRPSAG